MSDDKKPDDKKPDDKKPDDQPEAPSVSLAALLLGALGFPQLLGIELNAVVTHDLQTGKLLACHCGRMHEREKPCPGCGKRVH